MLGYSQLIDKIREYAAHGQSHGKAVDMTIDFCIDHGILYDFLAKHRAEVIKMFNTDYSMKKYRKMLEYNHQKELARVIAEKDAVIFEKDTAIAEKDAEITKMHTEIMNLTQQLEKK